MCINDVGDGLEGELCAWDADDFGDYESCGGEHGSAAVLELGLAEPREPLRGTLLMENRVGYLLREI